ncbi:MAG: hypothetical protein ACFE9S_14195 [Candidatus Hermodarchaeota archaeon]
MNKQKLLNNRCKKATFLLVLIFVSLIPAFLLNFANLNYDLPHGNNNDNGINDIDLETSSLGEHPWWNSNWPYRSLINITNLAGVDLDNYGVSVVLPYDDAVYQDKVNDTLKDIRVIEYIGNDPIEREFFIFQDFDGNLGDYSVGKATIYFNTNLTASSSPQTDTYIYFGNMNVESTAVDYGLGLVKNGDFEYVPQGDDPTGNPSVSPHYYNPIGWNWSDDVPDDIAPRLPDVGEDSQTEDQATEWWQNCLVDTTGGDIQVRGTYTYKWGSNQTSITDSTGSDDQYAGVLYTNPFVVPVVNDGSGKIYLRLWQNVRIWGFDGSSSKNWNDGYFIRVINASDNLFDDPDLHQQLGQYLGYFKGITHNNKGGYSLQNYTLGYVSGTLDTDLGQLTGLISFDLSDYMGQNISLELGMYGDENTVGNYDTGFVQVDDVEFTYNDDITTELNEIQIQKSDITIIARDIDGMIVPNAEVSLIQNNVVIKKQTTDITGTTIFTGLNFGIYNFTVEYVFSPSYEDEVFNSTRDNFGTPKWNIYNVSELDHTFNLYLDIWTIDFEFVDWDIDRLNYGYVNIYDDMGGSLLKKITLNDGTARFRWNNATFYYYEVYFDNSRYNVNNFLLNSSYIYRSDYEQNEKYYDHELSLATYDQEAGNYYRFYERIYTGGSMTDFSNKKLVNFNITLENMQDRIDNLTIYYIDENNETTGNIIFQDLTMSGTDFFESIDIGTVDNDKLKSENYQAYGILIEIGGYRSGAHTGLIKVNTTELINVYDKTALSKINIRVIDDSDSYNPVPYISVRIWNGSTLITTLTTYEDGWASHYEESYEPFIFLLGFSYNITLRRIGEQVQFKLNDTSPKQWEPTGDVWIYNYTLNQESSIIIDYQAAPPPPTLETQIELLSEVSQAVWDSGVLHITINVSYTENGIDWYQVPNEGTFNCYIEDWLTGQIVLTVEMTANYQGMNLQNYSLTINADQLSAGNSYKKYWFIIEGEIPGYEPPEPYYQQVQVNATATTMNLYDYETLLIVSEFDKEFAELINITVRYSIAPDSPLEDAILTFKWLNQPTRYFIADPLNIGYYYCEIDTSVALNVGKFPITITASKENYTAQTSLSFLAVIERPTEINGTTDLAYYSLEVYVQDTKNFVYEYSDILKAGELVGDLDIAVYTWQRLYPNGSIIKGIDGSGELIQNGDNTYTLDFSTELRSVGSYYLYVTLQKNNYEARAALINLDIVLRIFIPSIDQPQLGSNNQIQIDQGTDVVFEINLWDDTRDVELQNATIKLNFGGVNFTFNPSGSISGLYTLTLLTSNIDTFISSKTYVSKIFIEAANFTSQEIIITITVKMQEIWPGMPMFYFILITAAVVGVVGSIVGYRVIQQARIPKHVKKIRKIKGLIKSKKKVTESYSVPTKEQMQAKIFGDDWKEIGLSIEETLGIADLKKKSILKEKITKERGENK